MRKACWVTRFHHPGVCHDVLRPRIIGRVARSGMVQQLVTNALISGAAYALMAVGLGQIYAQARFINFGLGAVAALAPYGVLCLLSFSGLGLWLSVLGGLVIAIVVGCLTEIAVFRRLRLQNAASFILLLASLGIYVLLQNSISLAFGDIAKSVRSEADSTSVNLFGARVTVIQLITISVSIVAVVLLLWFQRSTRLGAAMRAVASDHELAKTIGIDVDRTLLWTFAIGSGLASLAGILTALDVDMTPKMGMNLLVMAMVAMILGGGRNVLGVVAGAYLLSIVQQLTAWRFSFEWQDASVFVVLTVFLLVKPRGVMGETLRKTTV
jgi:branched-chain amino acid transport system permease protein